MAEWAAMVRAMHPLLDGRPLVFEDPLAERLLGPQMRSRLHSGAEEFRAEGMLLIRSMMLIRSRFAEDELADALTAGTRQYVILGAGLDSFAWRQPPAAAQATLYEVDHPDTQAWKRERVAQAGLEQPANLRYVPVDFVSQSLSEGLISAGFARSAPAFFTWVGVTYYLPRQSFLETLDFIAAQAGPSRVVFDFALRDAVLPERFTKFNEEVFGFMREAGEPWQLSFLPHEIESGLRALGFRAITYLSPELAQKRYLRGRRDGLRTGPLVGLMRAEN
jgi:methyltransferase (TIGR00027 family)